ncbi:MAG: hypothetical protein HOI61_08905 [Gammaproteobacteria bacterium]|jgi:hypothetical protein|nr:hypothetical protein [Gammaproteobacteria bacterium]MBT4606620.1 hypothetical protein [Thiotrichales bacterium]MBT5466657.1 hypothetical protein [Candidatus Neomarinimicrobiota bacterium]MBT5688626.1 hypothetical protein [Gammaproteobacteria bacterium]MBT7023427.1 hypothetical protein [Gammaproteobacteria bacterium]
MNFEIISPIEQIETFARGSAIREIARLRKIYGNGKWRKCKGLTTIKLSDGTILDAELHWYEASGIGKFEHKIKHYL